MNHHVRLEPAGTHTQRSTSVYYYGRSRGHLTDTSDQRVLYRPDTGHAVLVGSLTTPAQPPVRIVDGDVLSIDGHQFTVHCPAGWPHAPQLRPTTQVPA